MQNLNANAYTKCQDQEKEKNIPTNLGGFKAQALQHKQFVANVKSFLLCAGFSRMVSVESLSNVSIGHSVTVTISDPNRPLL